MTDPLQILLYVGIGLFALIALLALLALLRATKPFKITATSQVFEALWALLAPVALLWLIDIRINVVYAVIAGALGVLIGALASRSTRFFRAGTRVDARVSIIPALVAAVAWVALAAAAVFLDSSGVSAALLLLVLSAFTTATAAIADLARSGGSGEADAGAAKATA